MFDTFDYSLSSDYDVEPGARIEDIFDEEFEELYRREVEKHKREQAKGGRNEVDESERRPDSGQALQ